MIHRAVLACLLLVSGCGGAAPSGGGLGEPDTRTTPSASQTSPPGGGSGIVPPTLGTRTARLADRSPAPVVAPRRLVVPRIGVDQAVVPVGVAADGQLDVPSAPELVSWYRFGPGLGASGTTVLAGHVDFDGRRGVFWRLDEMATGDELAVEDGSARRTYRVLSVERFDKAELPAEDLFRPDGPARVVLITCGGDFDAATTSYRANVVVTAVPA